MKASKAGKTHSRDCARRAKGVNKTVAEESSTKTFRIFSILKTRSGPREMDVDGDGFGDGSGDVDGDEYCADQKPQPS